MPHKRNPIRSERICGLARVVRGYVTPVMEGMALWHERDISHSSVERVALPDAAGATDYLLHLTTGLIAGLTVDAARMRANLESTGGLIYTSSVLLDLVAAGMSREDAYALVQAAAMARWDTGASFREALRKEAAAGRACARRGPPGRGFPCGTLRRTARPGLRPAGRPHLTIGPTAGTHLASPGTIGSGSGGSSQIGPWLEPRRAAGRRMPPSPGCPQ